MWPTLILVLLFVVIMACLPWLVRRLQQKNLLPRSMGMKKGDAPVKSQVLNSLAIGQQQRVVTVQVGEGEDAVRLILGVTAQQIQCLHVHSFAAANGAGAHPYVANPPLMPSFTDSLMRAKADGAGRSSGHV